MLASVSPRLCHRFSAISVCRNLPKYAHEEDEDVVWAYAVLADNALRNLIPANGRRDEEEKDAKERYRGEANADTDWLVVSVICAFAQRELLRQRVELD